MTVRQWAGWGSGRFFEAAGLGWGGSVCSVAALHLGFLIGSALHLFFCIVSEVVCLLRDVQAGVSGFIQSSSKHAYMDVHACKHGWGW